MRCRPAATSRRQATGSADAGRSVLFRSQNEAIGVGRLVPPRKHRSWLARFLTRRQRDLGHASAVQRHPGVLCQRIFVRVAQRLVGGEAVVVTTGELVTLLMRDKLTDRT